MSLQNQIKEEIKKAMLAHDTVRLTTVRGLSAAFVNELVAKGKRPQEELPDADALTVIKRLVKQRKDSIEQFTAGGRKDLADNEKAEMAILEKYLPASMPKSEIKKVAQAKKKELGITDKAGVGKLIGAVSKELKGKADGADIKDVVESLWG